MLLGIYKSESSEFLEDSRRSCIRDVSIQCLRDTFTVEYYDA